MTTDNRLLSIVLALFLAACSTSYKKAEAFDLRTAEHRKIAVFPFWVKLLGSPPAELSPEELDALLWQEGIVLQRKFYRQLQEMQEPGDSLQVRIQPVGETLAIIEQEGFTLSDLYTEEIRKIASAFGVDAFVRTRIEKARLFKDLSAYGITIDEQYRELLDNQERWSDIPGSTLSAREIGVEMLLLDRDGGVPLWTAAFSEQVVWYRDPAEIIDDLTRKAARNFPYQE